MKDILYEENGKFYRDRYDRMLGVQRKILDLDKATLTGVDDYGDLRDLLGMKLHYVQPVYLGRSGKKYSGMTFHFIGDDGSQKAVTVQADEYVEDIDDLPRVWLVLEE